jgi:hypothetical protein
MAQSAKLKNLQTAYQKLPWRMAQTAECKTKESSNYIPKTRMAHGAERRAQN